MSHVDFMDYVGPTPQIVSITVNVSMDTERKISSFAALPRGWDYGSGGPIAQSTLETAFEWNSFLRGRGFLETDAFPGGAGEVVIAAGYGDHYLEIIVEPDGKISVAYDRNGKQELYLPNMAYAEAKWTISSIVGQIWSLSGYYIPTSSTNVQKNSLDWPSEIRKKTGASQSWGWNVLKSPEPQSALTSGDTMSGFPASSAVLPSFESSNQPYYRRATR